MQGGLFEMARTPITKSDYGNMVSLVDLTTEILRKVNTAAEEEIYRVTIPRRSLGLTDKGIHVVLDYSATQNVGANIIWRVYYGTSAPTATPANSWANSVNMRYGRLNVWLVNTGDVETQALRIWEEGYPFIGATGALTQESNKDLDLVITTQFSAAHASVSIWRLVVGTYRLDP